MSNRRTPKNKLPHRRQDHTEKSPRVFEIAEVYSAGTFKRFPEDQNQAAVERR